MAVIGFHYKKMLAEKKKMVTGKINVGNNIVISEIKEAKINMGGAKEKGIECSFTYKISYDPDIAVIEFQGAVVYLDTAENVKEIMTKWEEEKNLPKEVLQEVYNYILSKCNIEALIIERDMQLPPHLPMPKVVGK